MLAGQAKVDSKRLAAAEKALEKMVASAAKAAPKDTAAEPTDAKHKMLEAAVDGKLDMRSALGQQFARSATGGKSDRYREAKTLAAKKNIPERVVRVGAPEPHGGQDNDADLPHGRQVQR